MHSYSIIIPAYNAEKTIIETLDSCLSQSFPPKEIIVVDDGSHDSTPKIVQEYKKKSKKIILLSQKNSGPAKARNNGAKQSTADILVFTDSDCILTRDFAKYLIKPFDNPKISGAQGAYRTKQKSLTARFVQLEIEERYQKMLSAENLDWIGSYAAAYRKKDFPNFDTSFPSASGEDPELSYNLQKQGKKLVFIPQAIVYHTHPSAPYNYFKVKFFRAYYRVLLYRKHPDKILNDSYTVQRLKFQIGFSILLLPGIFYPPLFFLSLFMHFILSWPLVFLSISRDPIVAFLSLFFELGRSIVFSAGLLKGSIDRVLKK